MCRDPAYVYVMDGELQKANAWSRIFIGAAIEVHRLKGPGLLEPIYRRCVRRECELGNIPTKYELIVPIEYRSFGPFEVFWCAKESLGVLVN